MFHSLQLVSMNSRVSSHFSVSLIKSHLLPTNIIGICFALTIYLCQYLVFSKLTYLVKSAHKMTASSGLKYDYTIVPMRSCPAVSKILTFMTWPSLIWSHMLCMSVPIVLVFIGYSWKFLFRNLYTKLVLPTSQFPIIPICTTGTSFSFSTLVNNLFHISSGSEEFP